MSKERKEVKIILLGESGVGKTCIINRYINNDFNIETPSTLGSAFATKEVKKGNTLYNVNLWDTTGQEKYHSVTNLFIKGSHIVLLVYSIDSLASYDGLNYWYSNVTNKLEGDSYVLAIVGSKCDLINEEAVSEGEGKKFAQDKKAKFFLVSAKEDQKGINRMFDTLLDELISNNNFEGRNESCVITKNNNNNNKDKKKKGFC